MQLQRKINQTFIEVFTEDKKFIQNTHKYMKLKAIKDYKEGQFMSFSLAMKSVPSIKLIKRCAELMENADMNKHEIISWSKEKIEKFLA